MFYVTLMQINVVKIYIQFHIPTGVLSFPGDTEAKSAMVLPKYSFYTNFERGPANLITRDQWLLLQRIVCRHLFMKIHNKTFVNLPVICLKCNFIKKFWKHFLTPQTDMVWSLFSGLFHFFDTPTSTIFKLSSTFLSCEHCSCFKRT